MNLTDTTVEKLAIPRRISRRDPENKFLNGIPLRRENAGEIHSKIKKR